MEEAERVSLEHVLDVCVCHVVSFLGGFHNITKKETTKLIVYFKTMVYFSAMLITWQKQVAGEANRKCRQLSI